jgi:cytochrome P450
MKEWSDQRAIVLWGKAPLEETMAAARGFVAMQRYCAELIEARRLAPRDDLISILTSSQLDGEAPLRTSELVGQITAVISAGHETTTNLIAHLILLLLRHPDEWAAVRADYSLIPGAVEEALRLNSPIRGMIRTTTENVEVAGVAIPAGARLQLMYSSANHDETVFPDPERFDIRREHRPFHLGFGHGTHFCVGAPLARLEARVTVELFAERLPNLRLLPDHPLHYTPNVVFFTPTELPLVWDAPPTAPGAPAP